MTRCARSMLVALALAVVLAVSGCSASFSPERLPTAASMRNGATMYVQFGTVMNLPNQSKVTVNGVAAGVVTAMAPSDGAAVATLTLDNGIAIGTDAQVELRQDTLLGDTYVAITNPADAWSRRLPAGGTLGKDHVKAPVQIEDLFVSLSNFLGGGALPQLGNSFAKVNGAFPADPAEVRRLSGTMTETLSAWGNDIDQLNGMLQDLTAMTGALAKWAPQLSFALSPEGMTQVRGITDTRLIGNLVMGLSRSLRPMVPAVPLLKSLTQMINSVILPYLIPGWPQYQGQDSNATRLVDLLTTKVVPFLKNAPAVNVRSVAIDGGVSNRQIAESLVRVFRTIGMVR